LPRRTVELDLPPAVTECCRPPVGEGAVADASAAAKAFAENHVAPALTVIVLVAAAGRAGAAESAAGVERISALEESRPADVQGEARRASTVPPMPPILAPLAFPVEVAAADLDVAEHRDGLGVAGDGGELSVPPAA